jgi:serine/threonine-protein kinase
MGLVYEAEHLTLGSSVALKVLRPERIDYPDEVERITNEARYMAMLRGEHVVRVLDAGRLDTGLPFFAMERLQGLDLQALLRRCGRLPAALAVDYALQTCAGLMEAHAAGIIHRDIKPSNLFLASHATAQSRIKLLDFGIARGAASGSVETVHLGSASYASPEQANEPDEVDERSDIWSLGVVCFEMLTGTLPVERTRFGRRKLDVRSLEARHDLPPGLAAILRVCLAEQKAARFGSVRELAEALAALGVERRPCAGAPVLGRLRRSPPPCRPRGVRGVWCTTASGVASRRRGRSQRPAAARPTRPGSGACPSERALRYAEPQPEATRANRPATARDTREARPASETAHGRAARATGALVRGGSQPGCDSEKAREQRPDPPRDAPRLGGQPHRLPRAAHAAAAKGGSPSLSAHAPRPRSPEDGGHEPARRQDGPNRAEMGPCAAGSTAPWADDLMDDDFGVSLELGAFPMTEPAAPLPEKAPMP